MKPILDEKKAEEFSIEFQRLWSQDPSIPGRALQCHLLLEWSMSQFLKAACPRVEQWENARLTFSQKFALLNFPSSPVALFAGGISLINKIRNSLAHNPDWQALEFPDLSPAKNEILNYLKKQDRGVPDPFPTGLAMLELFTHIACPFIVGASVTTGDKVLYEIIFRLLDKVKDLPV